MSLSICHTGTQKHPAAFHVSVPHLAVFGTARQEARTSTGFQGSERKHSLGDDSKLGQGGSLLSSSVRHGNAVPKAGEWLSLAAHFAINQQNYDD